MAVRINEDTFEEKVLQSQKPVVVDFYTDSCVACKKLSPVLGDIEDNFEDQVSVFKVNTNFDLNLAQTYEVMANPTLILFKNGEATSKKVGALSYQELEQWVKENI